MVNISVAESVYVSVLHIVNRYVRLFAAKHIETLNPHYYLLRVTKSPLKKVERTFVKEPFECIFVLTSMVNRAQFDSSVQY